MNKTLSHSACGTAAACWSGSNIAGQGRLCWQSSRLLFCNAPASFIVATCCVNVACISHSLSEPLWVVMVLRDDDGSRWWWPFGSTSTNTLPVLPRMAPTAAGKDHLSREFVVPAVLTSGYATVHLCLRKSPSILHSLHSCRCRIVALTWQHTTTCDWAKF